MTAPDLGLADLIAADLAKHRFIPDEGDDEFGSCSCLTWRGPNHDRHVALVVEPHTNGRIAEARQWDGTRASIAELAQWANANDDPMDDFTLEYSFTTGTDVLDVRIATQNGDEVVSPGDWIIRDTAGEFHLCRTVRAALEGEQQ